MKVALALLGLLAVASAQMDNDGMKPDGGDRPDDNDRDMPGCSPDGDSCERPDKENPMMSMYMKKKVFKKVCMPMIMYKVKDMLPDKLKDMLPGMGLRDDDEKCEKPEEEDMDFDKEVDWDKVLNGKMFDWEKLLDRKEPEAEVELSDEERMNLMEKMEGLKPDMKMILNGTDIPLWLKMKLASKVPNWVLKAVADMSEEDKMKVQKRKAMFYKVRLIAAKKPVLDMIYDSKYMPDWEEVFAGFDKPNMEMPNITKEEFYEMFKQFIPDIKEVMKNNTMMVEWVHLRILLDMPVWVKKVMLTIKDDDVAKMMIKEKMTMWFKKRVAAYYTYKIFGKGDISPDWKKIFSNLPGMGELPDKDDMPSMEEIYMKMMEKMSSGMDGTKMPDATMPDWARVFNGSMPDFKKIFNMSEEEWGEKIADWFPAKEEGEPEMPKWIGERIGSKIPDIIKILMVSDKIPQEAKMEAKRRIMYWVERRIEGCYNNKFDDKEEMMDKMKELMEKLKEKMDGKDRMDGMDREEDDEDEDDEDMMVPEDWMTTRDWPMAGTMEERMRRLELVTMAEAAYKVKQVMDSVKGMMKMAPVVAPFIKYMLEKKMEKKMDRPDGPDRPATDRPGPRPTMVPTGRPSVNPSVPTARPSIKPNMTKPTDAPVVATTGTALPALQRKFEKSGVFVVPAGVTSVDVIAIGGGGGGKNGAARTFYGNNGGTSSFGTYVIAYGGKGSYGLGAGGQGGYASTKAGGRGGIATGETCSAGGGAAGQTGRESDLKGGFSNLPFCGAGGAPIPKACARLDAMNWKKAESGPGGFTFFSLKAGMYGGGGASVNGGRAGGGGGFSRARVNVTPGEKVDVTVGLGGTSKGGYWGANGVVVVAWRGDINPLGEFTTEVSTVN